MARPGATIVTPAPPTVEGEEFSEVERETLRVTLAGLRLWTPEAAEVQASLVHRQLAEKIVACAVERRSSAILVWPSGGVSLAAAHVFAALALASAPEVNIQPTRHRLVGRPLRALFFPYTIRTRTPLHQVLVDRTQLAAVSATHVALESQRAGAHYDYFARLMRARDLTGEVRGGGQYFEYEHPELDEVVAIAGVGRLTDLAPMHRIAQRTFLAQSSLGVPQSWLEAPYAVLALSAQDRFPRAIGARLDVVLLDLTRSGRNRFRRDWRLETAEMLKALQRVAGAVPVVAVTEDPWVQRVLGWELLKAHDGIGGKAPANMDAVLAVSPALVEPRGVAPELAPSPLVNTQACGVADHDGELLDDIAKAVRKAESLRDTEAAELLREVAATIARTAALPGGVTALGRFVSHEVTAEQAALLMAPYRVEDPAHRARTLVGPFAQERRKALDALFERAARVAKARLTGSPIAERLRELIKSRLNSSTATIVWLATPMLSDFAEEAFSSDDEIGARVATRIERNMLAFMDAIAFRELHSLPPIEQARTKVLILANPSRSDVLSLAARQWLPDTLIIVADARSLTAIARDAGRLAAFPAFEAYRQRLTVIAEAAAAEAKRVAGYGALEDDAAPPVDLDYPEAAVVDLAGARRPGEKVLRIETAGRQVVLARPKTRIILYDESRPIPTFGERPADEVEVGDRICVINDAFVDMARSRLDIRAAAAEEIRDYHRLVQEQFAKLEGATHAARLRTMLGLMGDPEISEDRARRWTKLEREDEKPLDLVQPRAPQDRPTFLSFMRALKIPDPIAQRYWIWAVIATRRGRLKAAQRLHESYLRILVDPYTALAGNAQRAGDIKALRAAAEGHVATVTAVSGEREPKP